MSFGKTPFYYIKMDEDIVYYRIRPSGKVKIVDVFTENKCSGDLEFQFGIEFDNHEKTIDVIKNNWDDFDFDHDGYYLEE